MLDAKLDGEVERRQRVLGGTRLVDTPVSDHERPDDGPACLCLIHRRPIEAT
jgi:hypothetical protein